jgi:hypothetical protein
MVIRWSVRPPLTSSHWNKHPALRAVAPPGFVHKLVVLQQLREVAVPVG